MAEVIQIVKLFLSEMNASWIPVVMCKERMGGKEGAGRSRRGTGASAGRSLQLLPETAAAIDCNRIGCEGHPPPPVGGISCGDPPSWWDWSEGGHVPHLTQAALVAHAGYHQFVVVEDNALTQMWLCIFSVFSS